MRHYMLMLPLQVTSYYKNALDFLSNQKNKTFNIQKSRERFFPKLNVNIHAYLYISKAICFSCLWDDMR